MANFAVGTTPSLLIRLLIRHLIRTTDPAGVQQKKDVYKKLHDFKINITVNKIAHFMLISPVDIKIGYFCILNRRIGAR